MEADVWSVFGHAGVGGRRLASPAYSDASLVVGTMSQLCGGEPVVIVCVKVVTSASVRSISAPTGSSAVG